MNNNKAEQTLRDLLRVADVELNGDRPFDFQALDDRVYARVLSGGAVAFGESYMEGWWDCAQLDELSCRVLKADLERHVTPLTVLVPVLLSRLGNRQRRSKAFKIGEHHYDIGNDLYQRMLDKRLTYTCAYWKDASNLDQAQEAKLDLVCRKIGLEPGMKVLDIGCGWGSFARFAAEKYQAEVVGVTVSKEQLELGASLCGQLPVDLRLQDYRDITDTFDRVVSLGMFEHVGSKNYATFMQIVDRCLRPDGLFLLHTIGTTLSNSSVDAWMDKYIFPGGMLPTERQLAAATEDRFVLEDWHNFGADYDRTLLAWMANFDAHWSELEQAGYDQVFYRMWRFYLLATAGSFRARRNQLWQIVYSRQGVAGGYQSVR